MATFESIPREILLLIFQSIDSVAQLGQCRQVCKKWDDPAEFVMFCKPISITDYNAMPLYTHLSKKSSRAKLIKTLYFDFYTISSSIIQLLRLALTPSIERIIPRQEFYNHEGCFEIILDIADESQEGFPNVKSIPAASEFTDIYRKTLLLFKDSIETICIPIDKQNERFTFDELKEFKQLSKIILNGYFEDLPHVESILGKACHLKEIEFGTCEFDLLDNNWSTQETFDWMKQHVQINQNVTTIKLTNESDHNSSLMEYLAYKYPNTKHLDIEACEFFHTGNENERICRAISKIPNYSMTDLNNFKCFFPYLKILKGDKNMFQLTYVRESCNYPYEDGSTLEIRSNQDQQRITKSQIIIHTDLHSSLLYNSHVQFLKEIGGFATDLEMDFVKAYDDEDFAGEDWDRPLNIEAKIFFTALNQARGLESMKFIAHNIAEFKIVKPQPSQRRRLNRLEIASANVDPKTFHALNGTFHTINHLIISNCYIHRDETKTTNISMTSTKVETLLINANKYTDVGYSRFIPSFYKRKNEPTTNGIYIMLSLQNNKTAIFKVQPKCSSVLPVSMADYTSRPNTIDAFHISCESLGHLELNMDDIHVKLDIAKYFETIVQ